MSVRRAQLLDDEWQGKAEEGQTPTSQPIREGSLASVEWAQGIYAKVEHGDRPSYYRESPLIVRGLKVIALSMASILPYYLVLDQVTSVKDEDYTPCSNRSCTYMRIYGSEKMPGTGMNFVRVQNGVSRPIALEILPFRAIRPFAMPLESDMPRGPTPIFESDSDYFKHGLHNSTRVALMDQKRHVAEFLSWTRRSAFSFAKTPLRAVLGPASLLSQHLSPSWGMEHLQSALCPNMNSTQMHQRCEQQHIKGRIVNHLDTGCSRYCFQGSIFLWFLLTIAHDFMLLSDRFENYVSLPLYVGAAATLFQGLACAALFIWSMGATQVFPARANATNTCTCYYILPSLWCILALGMPFSLLFDWAGKVQMLAMSSLYGDYLYSWKFTAPHHLVKQSLLWTWSTLVSTKVTGTTADKGQNWHARIMSTDPEAFNRLYLVMKGMWFLRVLILLTVVIAASPFMVRVKELILALSQSTSGALNFCLRFIVQPLPSVVIVIIGAWAVLSLRDHVLHEDNLRMLLDREVETKSSHRSLVFGVLAALVSILTFSSTVALWPSWREMWDPASAGDVSIIQAEVWGSAGFAWCGLVVFQVIREVYIFEHEMNLLRKVGDLSDQDSEMTTSTSSDEDEDEK